MSVQVPLSLTRHLAAGRCVLFVGAGLSAAARLPTWGQLLDEVLKELESDGDLNAPELRRLWEAKKYLDVADHCADVKPGHLRDRLMSLVRGATEPVPDVHKIIRSLPFAGIVTTNYDKLLERAYWEDEERRLAPKVHTHASTDAFGTLLFDRAFFIVKAHGDIDEPQTIVLSTKSYRELIHANPAFNAFFSAVLLNFSILFVGYSLNDPDFRLLMERQITDFQGTTPIRYALMGGVGTVEAQILQRNAGIQVIHYPAGEHSEVLTFFQQLREKVDAEQAKKPAVPVAVKQPAAPPVPAAPPAVPLQRRPAQGTRGVTAAARPAAAAAVEATSKAIPTALNLIRAQLTPTLTVRIDGAFLEAKFEKRPALGILPSAGVLGGAIGSLAIPGFSTLSALAYSSMASPPVISRTPVADWKRIGDLVGNAIRDGSRRSIDAAGEEMRTFLSAEVLGALESLDPASLLAIVAEPPLETVPWEWLPVGGDALCMKRPVFRRAATALAGMPLPPSVLVIGDPHGNLPGAAREAREVAKICGTDAALLVGREATFQRVVDLLESRRFDVLHFAGHAWIEDGQAHVYLADSAAIGARELRSFISRNPPAMIFLNSHFTAFVPIGVSVQGVDNQTMTASRTVPTNVFGFIDMATSAGVGALIGCIGSPDDAIAQEIGIAFHREVAKGASAAEALFRARVEAAKGAPDAASPFLYVGSGAGWLRGTAGKEDAGG
jgi:SIR2-like domain/CHAT domain